MNITKLGVIVGVCSCFCLAFLASAEAGEFEQPDIGISFESWLPENGVELPVLSFNGAVDQELLSDDIEAENMIHEKDGATRFQLSHRGPLGREIFANVRSVARGDGFTRNIITSTADGSQREFLSRTENLPAFDNKDKAGDNIPVFGLEKAHDQDTECFTCLLIVVSAISCVIAENMAYQQCFDLCQSMGGIKSYDGGTCGVYSMECSCYTQPPKTAIEF